MKSRAFCFHLLLMGALLGACERQATTAGENAGAARAAQELSSDTPAKPPKLVTIDDVEGLLDVEFTEADGGMRAAPKGQPAEGHLAFLLPEGVVPKDYRNFAQFIAGKGWSVFLAPDGKAAVLDGEYGPERCSVVGGVGEAARAALKFGYERRESVDGAIVVGLLLNEDETYKKRFPIAIVAGGRDGVAPRSEAAKQYPQYPSQTYLLTIEEANHAGYYEDQTFKGDGEALVPAAQQRLILGEVASNMVDRFCLTRETRLAEAAREAAREVAKSEQDQQTIDD